MNNQLVSYYLSTQDWRTEAPIERISHQEARRRKQDGDYFVNGDVMIKAPHIAQEREFQGWRVVDQSAKPGVQHRPTRIGPGFPRYALV